MKRFWLIVLTGSLVALAGCHSFKKENIEPPTPLAKDFKPTVQVKEIWSTRVGHGAGVSGIRMRPAVVDGVVYAGSTDGDLAAFDATSGKNIWTKKSRTHGWFGWGDKKRKDAFYSGGPGVSGDMMALGTLDGHVYALNTKDGSDRWTAALPSEVIAPPVIVGQLVIVRTQDGRIYGLDSGTGERRWVNDQGTVPLLSLRGYSAPLAANGVLFYGSDDGKLIALRLDNGEKLWEQKLSTGTGRTDIDRMDDADGAISLDGTTLYGAAYHGNLVAVDGPSGRPLWTHPLSTYTSVAIGANAIYAANDQSEVWAFDKTSGSDMWKSDALKYRWLTAPSIQGDYLVVGDIEGYIHWLRIADGALAGRERLSKKAIRGQPVVVNNIAYVEDVEGHLAAYSLGAQ